MNEEAWAGMAETKGSARSIATPRSSAPNMPMRWAFGGADLASLFVTSADGAVYRARTQRKGMARVN